MTTHTEVKTSTTNGVTTIVLDGSRRHNAISSHTIQRLAAVFDEVERDDSVSVVVITGSGASFCSGADLAELGSAASPQYLENFMARWKKEIIRRIESLRQPVIAAIEGPCVAGGMEIAMTCDLRVASSSAYFADPEVANGMIGAYQRLVRLSPGLGRYLMLTGRRVHAATAAAHGLVTEVVPAGGALESAQVLATDIARHPLPALAGMKQLLNHALYIDNESGDSFEQIIAGKVAAQTTYQDRIERFGST